MCNNFAEANLTARQGVGLSRALSAFFAQSLLPSQGQCLHPCHRARSAGRLPLSQNIPRAAFGITICPRVLSVTAPQRCLPAGAGARAVWPTRFWSCKSAVQRDAVSAFARWSHFSMSGTVSPCFPLGVGLPRHPGDFRRLPPASVLACTRPHDARSEIQTRRR